EDLSQFGRELYRVAVDPSVIAGEDHSLDPKDACQPQTAVVGQLTLRLLTNGGYDPARAGLQGSEIGLVTAEIPDVPAQPELHVSHYLRHGSLFLGSRLALRRRATALHPGQGHELLQRRPKSFAVAGVANVFHCCAHLGA